MTRAARLTARLRAGVPTDTQAVPRLLDLLAQLGDRAFDADTVEPGHITASGFVVHGDAVLLVLHGSLGRWMQPGGHVEPTDEDTRMAARREVVEETGVDELEDLGLLDVDVHEIPLSEGGPAHLHFDVRWGFRASTDTVRTTPESVAVAWVPVSWAESIDESLARPIRALGGGSLAPPVPEVNP